MTMNLRKFLRKMAQLNDLPQVESPSIDESQEVQPQPQAQEAQPGMIDTSVPVESPNIIQTDVAEWAPRRGRGKGSKYYYLQLINVTSEDVARELENLGYRFNARFNNWSKQVKSDNVLGIESEFSGLEEKFRVVIDRQAIPKLQEIFGFTDETSAVIGEESTASDIDKLKFIKEEEQQEVAEELITQRLMELANQIDSPETQEFLDQYLSIQKATIGKVHNYSFLNNMLIALQNRGVDPETGEVTERSGFIAPASIWEKEFGRKINEEEEGMDIFVPKGGAKTMKPAGFSTLIKALGQYRAINKGQQEDLTQDENLRKLFGLLKSQISKKQLFKSNYDYLVSLIHKNKEKFKTLKDVINYLKNKADNQETEQYYTRTTFLIKPVIYDIDQTSVIPGQEHKDPKPKMDEMRAMWLGLQNEPDELVDTMYDSLVRAAKNGILTGKPINISEKATGRSGGWSEGGEIAIDKTSAGIRRFRTLVHEAAHEILHWGSDRIELTHAQKEVDADATAYIVLNHFGVGTGEESRNYIALKTGDKDFIKSRFQPVLHASRTIISAIDKQKSKEYDQMKKSQINWYKKFKKAHYSEPEQKGEGYGGTGQFGERRLSDWEGEHKNQVTKMKSFIKSQDWTNVERYRQELMEYYEPPYNKKIVDGIIAAATSGVRF